MSSRVSPGYSSMMESRSVQTTPDVRQQMNVNIKQQPRAPLRYNPWEFENPWSHDLCNFTEHCDEACYSIWCFPCFSCHLAWRMNESCWITCCLPGHLAVLRTKMRTTYRIKGSYLADFCVTECCPFCAVLQMASELRFRRVMI